MALSKDEIDSLRKLKQQLDDGELSDFDYYCKAQEMLRGRTLPSNFNEVLQGAEPELPENEDPLIVELNSSDIIEMPDAEVEEDPVVDFQDAQVVDTPEASQQEAGGTQFGIEELTTCAPQNKIARKQQLQRHEKRLLDSPSGEGTIASLIRNTDLPSGTRKTISLKPNLSFNAPGTPIDSVFNEPFYRPEDLPEEPRKTIEQEYEAAPPQPIEEPKVNVIPIAFGLTCLALVVLLLAQTNFQISASVPTPAKAPKAKAPPQIARFTASHIKPLFGPAAVTTCQISCQSGRTSLVDTCLRACQKLGLDDYARRVLPVDPRPHTDAQKIVKQCTSSRRTFETIPANEWKQRTKNTLELINSIPRSLWHTEVGPHQLLYNKLLQANASISIPQPRAFDDSKLAKLTHRATCLRANLTLTELGIIIAKKNSDSFSSSYYGELHRALRGKTYDYESNVFTLLEKTKLLSNEKNP